MKQHIRNGTDRRKSGTGNPSSSPVESIDFNGEDRRHFGERRQQDFISIQQLCAGIDHELLEPVMSICPVLDLEKDDLLLTAGKENHHLFTLLSGRLDVYLESLDSPKSIAIYPGDCTGEMSIIDGKPASAFVVAGEQSRVLSIHEDIFWQDLASIPGIARNLLRLLTERTRRHNQESLKALEHELRIENLENELQFAREIQLNMLVKEDPLFREYEHLEAAAMMEPAREVGGDFYDAFPLNDKEVCIVVGDVSGKGMPAALFMVRAMTLFRMEMSQRGSLANAITRLNTVLCQKNERCMFVTGFFAKINANTGKIIFINAGHNLPYVIHSDMTASVISQSSGIILGIDETANYDSFEYDLKPGDTVLLYTDGVTEAANQDREFFSEERLLASLSNANKINVSDLIRSVRKEVSDFTGEANQSDDITLLSFRYH